MSKVTVWYMTEEERLAYIKKHPIIPTEKPKGAEFSNIPKSEKKRGRKKVVDKNIGDSIHKMFIDGKSYREIAKSAGVSYAVVQKYIYSERQKNPKEWPKRF